MPKKLKKNTAKKQSQFWKNGLLSEKDEEGLKKMIEDIEKKYGFSENFRLFDHITHLPTEISFMQNSNFPRLSKKKKDILEIYKAAKKLGDILMSTPFQSKYDIQNAPKDHGEKGYKQLEVQNGDWTMSKFSDSLETLERNSLFAYHALPEDKGGRNASSIPIFVTNRLAFIYKSGTGEDPSCGYKDEEESHVGDFYNFLLDLKKPLSLLGIKLGKPKAIGSDAREAVSNFHGQMELLSQNVS